MTAAWDEVLGQPAAATAMRAALTADEVSHAWMLVGPSGVGQRELARALGAALNCPERDRDDAGCGVCVTCDRIARGVHSAVVDLEPEGASHLVDAVHEWITTASRTPAEGTRRVFRVVAAERMNEAAQNAFLKILEEPPASVVWILDVADESAMLDTIASRCRRLDVVPWGPDPLRALARRLEVDDERVEAVVHAALGSPERLVDLADPDVAAARDEHLTLLDQLATGGPGRVIPLAKGLTAWARGRVGPLKEAHAAAFAELEEAYGIEGGRGWPPGVKKRLEQRHARLERAEMRRALDILLDTLASHLRDLLVVRSGVGVDQLVNGDHVEQLRRDAERLGPVAVVEGLRAVARTREALDRNGAPELQLERLLLTLALPLYATSIAS